MEGQYRGPGPSIFPLYIGERCKLAKMMSRVCAVVYVKWQSNCPSRQRAGGSNEKVSGSWLGSCADVTLKSMLRLWTRGGVPVFNLPNVTPSFRSESLKLSEGDSPARPAG